MPIHPTAIIDPSSEIDSTASVGPYAVVGPRVVIGPDVQIMAHVYIDKDTTIGRGTKVFPFVSLGADPQDLKYQGERTRLVIGERVTIRESTTIHRGTEGGGGITEIGDGCLIMATVHVAHDCRIGAGVILSSYVVLAGHVIVGENAIIGGQTAIHQFTRIGKYAFVGGGSGVVKDWPPYMNGASKGSRDVVLGGPNKVGLKRRNMPDETLEALWGAFKIVCKNRRPLNEVLEEAENKFGATPEVADFIKFYRDSERGTYR
ncbi:acyl-[acyl-carrier-protein]--UDP-N-acetylglucosamine O-acyltransferase [Deltaproteobacteria bacterium Smac51]|nr:acyl-[acyl-carrier-protein]--UDP-N-acetylglucosamine O-acyltransferase [Deltaproteobacteria bacterium Smac51]